MQRTYFKSGRKLNMGDVNPTGGKFPGIQADVSAAAQSSEDVKKQKEKETLTRGLGLEDIPDTPAPNVKQAEEAEETAAPDEIDETEAEDLLEQIESTIREIQDRLKGSTSKKIRYAANPNYQGERRQLLKSAFNDIKEVYVQLENIKEMIS